MRNWVGTRIQEDALKLPCRDCGSSVGVPCVGDGGKVLEAFPAHASRLSDATKAVERPETVGLAADTLGAAPTREQGTERHSGATGSDQ